METLPDWCPRPDLIDLSGMTDNGAGKAIRDSEGRAARRFDLTREVPFDVELVRLDEREHLLIGRMHHIAVDGWSFSLLLDDFERIYALLERGVDPGRLAPAPKYAHYAAAERAYVEGPGISAARDYWRAHFAGAAGPTELQAPPGQAGLGRADQEQGACVNVILPPGQAAELRAFAAARRTTLFPVLVSAFALMLREVTSAEDLVFGTTAAGHLPGTEEMIGVFVNPLPVRIDLTGRSAPEDVIGLVRDRLLEFHRHQRYVLADLVRHVPPFIGRDINETFHAYILFQNYPRPQGSGPRSYRVFEADDLAEESLVQLCREHGRLMRDYELVIVERADGGLSLNHWYTRSGRLAESQVRAWSEFYGAAAGMLGARPTPAAPAASSSAGPLDRAAVAALTAGHGCHVLAFSRRGSAPPGVRIAALRGDVRDPASVDRAFRQNAQGRGGLDWVVNAAGVGFAPVEEGFAEQWQHILDTNVLGTLNVLARASTLHPPLRHFVQIGSLAGTCPSQTPGNDVYSAAKVACVLPAAPPSGTASRRGNHDEGHARHAGVRGRNRFRPQLLRARARPAGADPGPVRAAVRDGHRRNRSLRAHQAGPPGVERDRGTGRSGSPTYWLVGASAAPDQARRSGSGG